MAHEITLSESRHAYTRMGNRRARSCSAGILVHAGASGKSRGAEARARRTKKNSLEAEPPGCYQIDDLVRLAGIEPTTPWFVARSNPSYMKKNKDLRTPHRPDCRVLPMRVLRTHAIFTQLHRNILFLDGQVAASRQPWIFKDIQGDRELALEAPSSDATGRSVKDVKLDLTRHFSVD